MVWIRKLLERRRDDGNIKNATLIDFFNPINLERTFLYIIVVLSVINKIHFYEKEKYT